MLSKNKTKTAFRETGGFFVRFFQELFPAIRYIFFFLKKKEKGCRCYLG